ncbi:cytochrome c peroxidase [Burkholderiales bacterium JOSHI_001]|nr:cytochrome c peroxidase [Burkholderiales bacterium JOSHI_001]
MSLLAALLTGAALGLPPLPPPRATQAALGRQLFFERRLSVNGTLSCAMCHVPGQGFAQNELATSVGMEGVSLPRNAPTLLNVAHVQPLFHDGRAATLEQQAPLPLLHPDEMANPSMAAVVARLARWPAYRPLFRRAFGSPRPTPARIAQALAAYQRTLMAAGSPFDRWRYGGDATAMTPPQQRGFVLFQQLGCDGCHTVGERDALFTDLGFHNTGVQARSNAARQADIEVQLVPGVVARMSPAEVARVGSAGGDDPGRQAVTGRPEDARAFRTPSLRNVALTAPYMHDGSLPTLQAVLDHYVAGGWPADAVQDRRLKPLSLTPAQRGDLLAFLGALTGQLPAP